MGCAISPPRAPESLQPLEWNCYAVLRPFMPRPQQVRRHRRPPGLRLLCAGETRAANRPPPAVPQNRAEDSSTASPELAIIGRRRKFVFLGSLEPEHPQPTARRTTPSGRISGPARRSALVRQSLRCHKTLCHRALPKYGFSKSNPAVVCVADSNAAKNSKRWRGHD